MKDTPKSIAYGAVKDKRAFTLIEVILSIVLIALITLPLMSIFLQSVKTDRAAKGVLNANYISQDYVEKLDAQTYRQALSSRPVYHQVGEYYLTATIEPYGTADSHNTGYVHLIIYDNSTMLAVLPDGGWQVLGSVPDTISISVVDGVCTLTCGTDVLTGEIKFSNCVLIINAIQKTSSDVSNVSLGTGCKAILYCQDRHDDDFVFSGTSETYMDLMTGETSLVHITTRVYEQPADPEPIAVAESYISIKNW